MSDSEEEEAFVDDGGGLPEERGGAYHMHCRMYENQYPEIDEVVMVQVSSIAEMGAYVRLLEYNNIGARAMPPPPPPPDPLPPPAARPSPPSHPLHLPVGRSRAQRA